MPGTWFSQLATLKAAVNCNIYVVLFKHDGSSYSLPNHDFEVLPYVAGHGGHAALSNIPIVMDDGTGNTPQVYYGGLTGATTHDTYSYIVDPAYFICDKWHTASVAPGYSISFKHIRLDPYLISDSSMW